MSMHSPTPEREFLDDLLIEHAVYGLSDADSVQMDKLVRQFELADNDRFDVAVAALDVAAVSVQLDEELPESLRQRVFEDASAYVSADESLSSQDSAEIDKVVLPISTLQPKSSVGLTNREILFGLATAASLLVAIASLLGFFEASRPSVAEQYQELLASRGSVITAFGKNDDSAGTDVSGDVLWNNSRQQGFMRLTGVNVNDPEVEQYQLWIFDTARSDVLPVDGGVFDVTADGEVIIPIDSRLPISYAKMCAITIEPPGGVVKSDRERMPLVAVVEEAAAP